MTIWHDAWHWISGFQTLVAGVFAVIAAWIGARALYNSARQTTNRQIAQERERSERRKQFGCLAMTSELQELARRTVQAKGTIVAVIGANTEVTDAIRERTYLTMPSVAQDWEVMSLLPTGAVERCFALNRKVNDHNFDISQAGGAFGAHDFRESLKSRADAIKNGADALAMLLGETELTEP
jgi:hypothetical protein